MIAITCSDTPSKGYSYAEATEVLDLFDTVLDGRATTETVDRMLEIVGNAQPITATMRPVRADDTANEFWREHAQRDDNVDSAEDGDGGELSITPAAGQQTKADKAARRVLRKIVENE